VSAFISATCDVPLAILKVGVVPLICTLVAGDISPIPRLPLESTRSASLPAVSTVNVSAAGNLMAVLVSPVWMILSAIDISLLAVIIPIESILVTSS